MNQQFTPESDHFLALLGELALATPGEVAHLECVGLQSGYILLVLILCNPVKLGHQLSILLRSEALKVAQELLGCFVFDLKRF